MALTISIGVFFQICVRVWKRYFRGRDRDEILYNILIININNNIIKKCIYVFIYEKKKKWLCADFVSLSKYIYMCSINEHDDNFSSVCVNIFSAQNF